MQGSNRIALEAELYIGGLSMRNEDKIINIMALNSCRKMSVDLVSLGYNIDR
jgi:hypothetical protein